jgi:hypothetical protein
VHLVGFLFIVVIADARNREPEIQLILHGEQCASVRKTNQLMCREIIAVGCEIGQNIHIRCVDRGQSFGC